MATLTLHSLKAGNGIAIDQQGTEITISSSGANSGTNSGSTEYYTLDIQNVVEGAEGKHHLGDITLSTPGVYLLLLNVSGTVSTDNTRQGLFWYVSIGGNTSMLTTPVAYTLNKQGSNGYDTVTDLPTATSKILEITESTTVSLYVDVQSSAVSFTKTHAYNDRSGNQLKAIKL